MTDQPCAPDSPHAAPRVASPDIPPASTPGSPPAARAAARRSRAPRQTGWTQPKMAHFLRVLGATHSVSAAADAVGMTRQSAYRLRQRLVGQPFDIAWEAAFEHGLADLAQVALDRALNGYEVHHYHKGQLVGTSRRNDERLTLFLLRHPRHALGRAAGPREHGMLHWDRLLDRVGCYDVHWTDSAVDADLLAEIEDFRAAHSNNEAQARADFHRDFPDGMGPKPESTAARIARWSRGEM